MRRLAAALAVLLGVASGGPAAATVPSAQPVPPLRYAGPLFFPSVAGLSVTLHLPHFCSAAVLRSRTRDLVVTAAHCVYGTGPTIELAPGFADGVAPYGVWSVRRLYVPRAWRAGQDPRADVAVLRMAPRAGRRIQDVVGSAPSGTPEAGRPVRVLGYPLGVGGRPVACTSTLRLTGVYPRIDCTGLPAGVSGGPWLQHGRIVGVTGGLDQGGCGATTYSAPIATALRRLVARAESGARGDSAPVAFLANAC
jgi:hypothetical protein